MKQVKTLLVCGFVAGWVLPGLSVLPDDLTLNIGDIDSDGQDEVLVLAKRSVRSESGYKLMTWDSTNGYVEVAAPEVRTYRGYVQDDPDMRVNANIEPGNTTMNANLSDGHALNYQLTGIPVSISGAAGTPDLGTSNTVVSLVADRVAPTPGGYIIPVHHMRRLDCAVTIDETFLAALGNVEAAVARVEQRYNDADFFYARDMGLAWEIGWCVVSLEANPATWYNEWFNVHSPSGAVFEIPQKFKSAGGAGASGDTFVSTKPRHTVGSTAPYAKSLGHEFAHTLGAGHWSSWGDVMSGSKSALGSGTVERMIGNAHVATSNQSPALVYGSPLPPFAMEDCVTMLMDTTLDIDVLENDYDGNGDVLSISYVDAVTSKGGTAEIVAGKVRYTPPPHWQGVDEFAYHVEDATGIANRTGYVKVSVHNNGLATHILFDETSGTTAYDVGAYQAHGTLDDGMTFADSVAGQVGNALEWKAGNDDSATANFWGTGDPLDGSLGVSLWVKYPSVPTAEGVVIAKGGAVIPGRFGNPRGGWCIGHTSSGALRFEGNLNRDSEYTYANPQFDLEMTNSVTAGTWHHLAMSMDRSSQLLRAWVDGQEITNTTFGTTIADGVIDNSHHPLVIFDSVSQQYQGTDTPVVVDDVRIYTKPLSDADVSNLFTNPSADIPAGAPSPASGTKGWSVETTLGWMPGKPAPTYEFDVYLGTDYTAVENATTNSPEYKGRQAAVDFVPSLGMGRTYYWRIDEVTVSDAIVAGTVWWLTTSSESPYPLELVNGSFEDPALAAGGSDDDIKDWYDAVNYTFTKDDDGGSGSYPIAPDGDNWAETDRHRWMYQQIGTYEENKAIKVEFILGKRSDKNSHNAYIGLYTSGNPALAADANVKLDDGHPLVDTVGATQIVQSVELAGATNEVPVEHSVILSTGTGFTNGEPLWLEIEFSGETGRKTLVDHVRISDVTDGDGDGMADLWELQYFDNGTAALAGGNADGDPNDNLAEHIAGMDPTNAISWFHVTHHAVGSVGFSVEWPSVAGRLYAVAWTDSLTNAFQTLEEDLEFPVASYADTNHTAEAQGFYQVNVRLK